MKKPSLADRMAEKTFHSDAIQKSWHVHMQAFRPILEPAFAGDFQTRLHLTAALNHISVRQFDQGLAKLEKHVKNACTCPADEAAYWYFMGLCGELQHNQPRMLACYTRANETGHRFYLPYMKVAAFYFRGCLYDQAEKNYRAAIDCLEAVESDERIEGMLAHAYGNLAGCLTMMHRYDEAEQALAISNKLLPQLYQGTEAMLQAARGNADRVQELLTAMQKSASPHYASMKACTEKILAHRDVRFSVLPVDDKKLVTFWRWFDNNAETLAESVDEDGDGTAVGRVSEKLLDAFPFLEEPPLVRMGWTEDRPQLRLKDMYAIGVADAYQKLMAACPETLADQWDFLVEH